MNVNELVETIIKAKEGDKLAVAELYSKSYNDIYYFALSTVKEPAIAEDVLQEVAIELINHIGDLKEPEGFKSWILTITYRKCMKYFSKSKNEIVDNSEVEDFLENLENETQEFIPGADLDSDELKIAILEMINTLSEEQRSATLMYYFNEMSVREIASVQDVAEGTVKSRLSNARRLIKVCVEKYEETHGVKLYSVGTLPLMAWFYESYAEATAMSQATAITTATVVAETVGVPVSSISTSTTVATNFSMLGSANTATGIIAKLSALSLATKITSVAVVGVTFISGTFLISQNNEEVAVVAEASEVSEDDNGRERAIFEGDSTEEVAEDSTASTTETDSDVEKDSDGTVSDSDQGSENDKDSSSSDSVSSSSSEGSSGGSNGGSSNGGSSTPPPSNSNGGSNGGGSTTPPPVEETPPPAKPIADNPLKSGDICNPGHWEGDVWVTQQGAKYDTGSNEVLVGTDEMGDIIYGHLPSGLTSSNYGDALESTLNYYGNRDSYPYGGQGGEWTQGYQDLYDDVALGTVNPDPAHYGMDKYSYQDAIEDYTEAQAPYKALGCSGSEIIEIKKLQTAATKLSQETFLGEDAAYDLMFSVAGYNVGFNSSSGDPAIKINGVWVDPKDGDKVGTPTGTL